MGCDIHLFVECKKSANGEKRWVSVDRWEILPGNGDSFEPDVVYQSIYDGRNYRLFSILANVRNEENIECISEPRGLPSNVTEMVKKEYMDDEEYNHSSSWLTLDELKIFRKKHEHEYALDWLIEMLKKKKESYHWMDGKKDSDLRIVFWFDS